MRNQNHFMLTAVLKVSVCAPTTNANKTDRGWRRRSGQGRAGDCSARLQVAGCQLPVAVEVNYSPVILLIATICSLELLQIDDNVSGESKQMMSPTEKIVCWPCCISQLDFVGSIVGILHCCRTKKEALNSHAQFCLAHVERKGEV